MLLQLVELEVLFEALERGVAGELLETGDMDALRDPARDRPSPQVVLGESGAVAPGLSGPFFDDEGDRIGVDRIGTNPVAVNTSRRCAPRIPVKPAAKSGGRPGTSLN
jgi:hypothetical protein